MKKTGTIKYNFIMNSLLTASSVIFPLITYPYASRVIEPKGVGLVSFASSTIAYFSMFAQLGIPTYGIRICAQVRDDKEKLSRTVHEIMFINLLTCLITYIAFFAAIFFIPKYYANKELFYVMGILILCNSIGAEWLYKGLELYGYITIRSVVFKFIALIAMFLFVRTKDDYIIYGAISILAMAGSNIINFFNLRKYIICRPLKGYNLRQHLRPIAIFFAMSIAVTVYTNMDNIMLGFIKGEVENGYYDAAVKIKMILVGFVASLGTVLMPRLSYYVEQGKTDEIYNITKKSLCFVMLLSVPLCLYFILFAGPSIDLLSGKLFVNSVLPMRLIMPTLIFIGFTNIMGMQLLVPLKKERYVLYSEIAGAVVNIVINIILIPKFGACGAAIGTVLAEIMVFLVQLYYSRDIVGSIITKLPYFKMITALLFSVASSVWTLLVLDGSFVTLVLSALLFFVSYVAILLLLKEPLVCELWRQTAGFLKHRTR